MVPLAASPDILKHAPSLRDEHKARTKKALREAALKLFATKGYDTTTIEEIAEMAGVSARTFFRYFPTKESVLFLGEPEWLQSFAEVYPSQPRALGDVDAMCLTLTQLAGSLLRGRRSMQLYQRAIASSATLRGREQDHRQEDVMNMAAAVAERRGLTEVDEGCLLLASIGLVTYWRAIEVWLKGAGGTDLRTAIVEEFAHLAGLMGAAERTTTPPTS